MTQHNYFTLTFMIRKARMSRSGEAPIFARLTISGQRAEFNINRSVDPDNWNAAKGLSKGKSKRDLELNKYLDSIRVRISEIHTMLVKEEEVINPNVIKQHFLGNAEGPKMLVEVFNYVNDQHKERFDRGDICDGTYLRWKRCAEYLSEFLQKREGREDVPIKKLTSGMIDDFEHFLRVNKGNSNNTAIRYVRFLKKVTRVALANKWLEEDPFIDKHYSRTTTNRGFLTEDEVKRIMALDFTELPRLDQVRDTFIFCCFTGLAFADISTTNNMKAISLSWWMRLWLSSSSISTFRVRRIIVFTERIILRFRMMLCVKQLSMHTVICDGDMRSLLWVLRFTMTV